MVDGSISNLQGQILYNICFVPKVISFVFVVIELEKLYCIQALILVLQRLTKKMGSWLSTGGL